MHRLLVLAPSYPYPVKDGTQLRVDNLFRRLPADYEITLLCFDAVAESQEEPLPAPLHGTCIRVPSMPRVKGWRASPLVQVLRPLPSTIWKFASEAMARLVRARAEKADAVLSIGLQMGQYFDVVPRGVPVYQDNYNVEWLILERMAQTRPVPKRWFWQLEAEKLRRTERAILRRADAVIAISEVDREEMARLAPNTRFYTVPNGVDEDFFGATPLTSPREPHFAFVGSFNWHVNEDAAVWFCDAVWPRLRKSLPDARLELIGRDPSPTVRALGNNPSVHVTGTVDDVRPYLGRAVGMIVPLRYGSGIRNKILEAFAAGRPVVSTSVGCEGLPVRHNEHLLVADTAEEFAAACARLVRDPAEAARLVAAGRSVARSLDLQATEQFQRALLAELPNRD